MLAIDPRVRPFDEPLSALDRNLRDTLKYSILELQRRTGKTAIYVTHDQSEAFAISDRIFVMNEDGSSRPEPAPYLSPPRTEFVAGFVGDNNAIPGEVVGRRGASGEPELVDVRAGGMRLRGLDPGSLRVGDKVLAFVRPENIEVIVNGSAADEPTTFGVVSPDRFRRADPKAGRRRRRRPHQGDGGRTRASDTSGSRAA